ncbi:hypothetical protein JCM19237_4517 [Photobacterium aphoticum]|uniref:Sel1 repeat family protein n=1 Tax=Photobacterium aphoticum TaxID=754436 RepID=A0A090QW37_9GAMM|nr:hypothetical protein JCM19237_4517 [Photobacterium aphoticum]
MIFLLTACSEDIQTNHTPSKSDTVQSPLSSPELYAKANTQLEHDDLDSAKATLQLAVDQGDIPSKELLGVLLLKETKQEQHLQGFKLITDAAQTNWPSAQFYLGSCLYSGSCGLPENKALSLYWLKRALDNGEVGAQMMIGFLEEELGISKITQEEYLVNQDIVKQRLRAFIQH